MSSGWKVAVALAAVMFIAGCDDPPASLAEVDRQIKDVVVTDTHIQLTLESRGLDAGERDMTAIAIAINKAAEWQAGTGDYKPMEFHVWVPTRDAHGNSGRARAMAFTLPADDLARINWQNMQHWGIVDLMQVTAMLPFGREMAAEWCGNDQNRQYARQFCMTAL